MRIYIDGHMFIAKVERQTNTLEQLAEEFDIILKEFLDITLTLENGNQLILTEYNFKRAIFEFAEVWN